MNKLLIGLMAAAFAASPVLAQTTAPAKDEKKAEAKKDAPAKADAKKEEPKTAEAKKDEAKKKPKGGC